jgi:hypothetical protein
MPAPLPPQIEPEPQPGDDLFSPEIMAEITNQEQKHGIYTAASFEKKRPVQAKACIKFLSDGMPVQDIARALNVSDRTVTAMADKHADEITDLEKHLGKKARRCAHYLLERVERNPGIIPAQAIGQTVRQFYEVGQLADGRPTEIIEETKRVDIYAHWQRFVAGEEASLSGKRIHLSGEKNPPIEAELVDPESATAAALVPDADPAAHQGSGPESCLQSDVLNPFPQGQPGSATLSATCLPLETASTRPGDPMPDTPAVPRSPAVPEGGGGDRPATGPGIPTKDNGSQKFYPNGDS